MANGGFLVNNRMAEATSIVSVVESVATGYDVNTVKNDIVSEVVKTAVANTIAFSINVTFPEPITFDSVAFIAHNCGAGNGGGLLVNFYSDSDFLNFVEGEGLISQIYDRYIYRKIDGKLTKVLENNTYKTFTEKTFQYIQFVLSHSTDFIEQLACLFIGNKFQLPENCNYDQPHEINFDVLQNYDNSNGQIYKEQFAEQEGFNLKFTNRHTVPYREDFKNLFREGAKIFVPDFDKKECYFGNVPSSQFKVFRDGNTTPQTESFEIPFIENF